MNENKLADLIYSKITDSEKFEQFECGDVNGSSYEPDTNEFEIEDYNGNMYIVTVRKVEVNV